MRTRKILPVLCKDHLMLCIVGMPLTPEGILLRTVGIMQWEFVLPGGMQTSHGCPIVISSRHNQVHSYTHIRAHANPRCIHTHSHTCAHAHIHMHGGVEMYKCCPCGCVTWVLPGPCRHVGSRAGADRLRHGGVCSAADTRRRHRAGTSCGHRHGATQARAHLLSCLVAWRLLQFGSCPCVCVCSNFLACVSP